MSRTLGRAAIVSLTLGAVTVACNPGGGHVASAGEMMPHADAVGARLAGEARDALARHQPARAIRYAEGAVAAAPGDPRHRALLGQAYLAAGRFASAETALTEALTITPDAPRASFDLALAQIALGRGAAARPALAALAGRVPDADLGLALALAGDREGAIAKLTDLVRAGKSDARARQNLALVFALDGRWGEARGMAMQDSAPDRINGQIAGWAELAARGDARADVAAMLGATAIAADPGRPVTLALLTPAPEAPPVALAAVAPLPVPVAPSPVAAAQPAPAITAPILAAPVAVAQAAPPAVPTFLAAPTRVAARAFVAPGPLLRTAARGGYVVQLGAFARAGALDVAWVRASRLSPRVATLSPVSGRASLSSGATVVRLSIGGFPDRGEAMALCEQIRAKGGACFVRAADNDVAWRWASRDSNQRAG